MGNQKEYKVSFNGNSFSISPDDNLLEGAAKSGISIPHTCGGKAKCLTCRFELKSGEITALTDREIIKEKKLSGDRLSCQSKARSDLIVDFAGPVKESTYISSDEHEFKKDGREIIVNSRVNKRKKYDRSLLLTEQEALKFSQLEMNNFLERIAKNDEEEIKNGTLKPAPSFGSEGYTVQEYSAARNRERLLYFNLEFTNKCNLACTGCFAGFGDVKNVYDTEEYEAGFKNINNNVKETLSLDKLKDIIDQAADLGAKTIDLIGGGEPLLSPLFFDLCEHSAKRGLEIEIFTNGTLITKEVAEKMASYKVLPFVKLYSSKSWVHDEMVGTPGMWEKAVRGINNLLDSGYGGSSGLPISLETIVVRKNLDELPTMWRYARENGMIPYFERFVGCHYDGDPGELLTPSELKVLWEELWSIDRGEYGFTWPLLPIRVGYTCATNFYSLYINYEGDVRPCSGTFVPLGNTNQISLEKILKESPVVKDLREYERPNDSWCQGCYYYETDRCPGCRGMAQANGSYMADDPLCFHNPNNLKEEANPRNSPHLTKIPSTVLKDNPEILDLRDDIIRHPIFHELKSKDALKKLFEVQVFFSWEYMQFVKCIQAEYSHGAVPWIPGKDSIVNRYLNELLLKEESYLNSEGLPISHFELCMLAAQELGINDQDIQMFLSVLVEGDIKKAIDKCDTNFTLKRMLLDSCQIIEGKNLSEIAGVLLFAKQDLIADYFELINENTKPIFSEKEYPYLLSYLNEHLNVKYDIRQIFPRIAGDDYIVWDIGAKAAITSLRNRKSVLDYVYKQLSNSIKIEENSF